MEAPLFIENFVEELGKCPKSNHFIYVINLKNRRFYYHQDFANYLGYPRHLLRAWHLENLLHQSERQKVVDLCHKIIDFEKQHSLIAEKCVFMYIHQLKKADGSYVKVLNRTRILERQSTVYGVSLCIDITTSNPSNGFSFDVILPNVLADKKIRILKFFEKQLHKPPALFSNRELEVLRVWSKFDSAKLAADQLEISVRTFETHLRNMRKKLGVKRSVDVLMHVKEVGLM